MSVRVQLSHVTKRYGDRAALCDVNWVVPAGSRAGVLGPSGAGKSTLLQILAGLDACYDGVVEFSRSGSRLAARPSVGMVFQNLGLWPHLSARQHLQCVLSHVPRASRQRLVESLLEEVRLLPEAWDRRPSQLSGGEAQRVAVARAVAQRPDLLLLDEPVAQMDFPLRSELITLTSELVRSRGMTAIYVTHSWVEIVAFCDTIAVLSGGRVVQEGEPHSVFWKPRNAEIARLTGLSCEIPRQLISQGLIQHVPPLDESSATSENVIVRPQQIRLISPKTPNRWRVSRCRPYYAGWMLSLISGSTKLELPSHVCVQDSRVTGVSIVGDVSYFGHGDA